MITAAELNTIELICFDFDGVFTDNLVTTNDHGSESVLCCRSDGIGLSRLKDIGIKMCIISTETNPVVSMRAKKLGLPVMQGITDKSVAVNQFCLDMNIKKENTMFVGNDINDISAFQSVQFPVGVRDSFSEIDNHIIFKTIAKGGKGAVREICDMIFKARHEA